MGFGTSWLVVLGSGPTAPPFGFETRIEIPSGAHRGAWFTLFGERDQPGPEVARRGDVVAILDGALYNGSALGAELRVPSESVRTDAEIALEAYEHFGEAIAGRLKGAFCLVVSDAARGITLLVRDHVGLHPLFYAHRGDNLYVSSSARSILRHQDVPRRVDCGAVAFFLRVRSPRKHETLLRDVARVPPAHMLRWDRNDVRVVRYWNPEVPPAGEAWDEEEEVERFGALLDRAVRRTLDCGPVGIYLSGGLDSVTVAALAADEAATSGQPPPVALSLAFPDPSCNEETVQRGIAESLGLPQVITPFDDTVAPEGLVASALDVVRRRPLLMTNIWSPCYLDLGREGRSRGCRTILTGGGGDEWLGVSPFYSADLIRRFDLPGLYRLWSASRRSHRWTGSTMLRSMLWTFGLRPLLGAWLRSALRSTEPSILRARERRASQLPPWLAPDPGVRRDIDGRFVEYFDGLYAGGTSFYAHESDKAIDYALLSMEYEDTFEDSRELGLAIRQPFLDVDLVEFLYRAQPALLERGGRSKGLVRETLERRFPKHGFGRQKKVMATDFFAERVLAEAPAIWRKLGGPCALADLGIVDPAHMGEAGGGIAAPTPARLATNLWQLLSIECWVREGPL